MGRTIRSARNSSQRWAGDGHAAIHSHYEMLCAICGRSRQQKPRHLTLICIQFSPNIHRCGLVRCRINARINTFFACVQSVAYAMPATHDSACKFHRTVTRLPSTPARFVLAFHHHNKGGTRGPCLETECTGCMRRVHVRWRHLAEGILSSRVRRLTPPNATNTGEPPLSGVCFLNRPRPSIDLSQTGRIIRPCHVPWPTSRCARCC